MPTAERRRSPRQTPRAGLDIALATTGGRTLRGRIADVSPHGLRFISASPTEATSLDPEAGLTIVDCPEVLSGLLAGRRLILVWQEADQLGARFDPPLSLDIEGFAARLDFVSF